ncbi:MAG: GTP-binding protein [Candidatus Omnitrophica bacterium]|nr:GTP-binding protein [Candidatus Omnitrophota bacterium]
MTSSSGLPTTHDPRLTTSLRIVFVGHVDHGKSTLVGRLLAETNSLTPQRIRNVEEICKEKGMKFEYAFLLDALEEEQDQGVTIDVSQVFFKSSKRPYSIIDAPGHKEFLKNMISGASTADVAILLIDAEEGLREQSKRHATLLSLLGVKTILIVINKMDLVDYKKEVFDAIRAEYEKHLASIKVTPHAFIPLAAYYGENLIKRSQKMSWYQGPSLLETLDSLDPPASSVDKPLRFPLQDVYKFDKQRIFAGRIESGSLSVGEELLFLPSKKTGVVKSIEKWHPPKSAGGQARQKASAGESIGIVLEDQIFVERGEVACRPDTAAQVTNSLFVHIFWMGNLHLEKGAKCILKLTTQEVECVVEAILKVINSSTLDEISKSSRSVAKNEVAELILVTKKPIVFDPFDAVTETGRFVLVHDRQVRGGGIILKAAEPMVAI